MRPATKPFASDRRKAAVGGLAFIGNLICAAIAGGQLLDRSREADSGWRTVAPLPATVPAWSGSGSTSASIGSTSAPPLFGSTPSGYVPSWNSSPNSWRIGVAIENAETGVVLTDVERGMPAERAGLVAGDAIVNVEGFQVGYVDGTLFDLGDELQRRTDPQGRVDLLAFDGRSRRLRTVRMQLVQQSSGGVRGQVFCRERITLSPQAALTVRLRDVTYPNWQNVTVGQQVIPNPPHPPIDFAIQVDPASLYPDHRYAVDAWLEDRGQILVQTAAATPVDPRTMSSPLQLSLVRNSPSNPGAPSNPTGGVYAVGQLEQIAQWYQAFLGRSASTQELSAWQSHLQAGRSPQDILAYILGSSEYFDRMGNQRDRYLSEVYRAVNGRAPTSADLQQYVNRYAQYGGQRSQFVRDLLRLQPAGQL